jgi:hypothetical protein
MEEIRCLKYNDYFRFREKTGTLPQFILGRAKHAKKRKENGINFAFLCVLCATYFSYKCSIVPNQATNNFLIFLP